jgi:hypothetical protein
VPLLGVGESGEFIFGMVRERKGRKYPESFVPPAKSFRFRQCPADWKVYVTAVLYFLSVCITTRSSTWRTHTRETSKSVPQQAVAPCMPMIRNQPGPRHDTGYSRQSRLTTRSNQESMEYSTAQTFRAMCCQRRLVHPCHPIPMSPSHISPPEDGDGVPW